MASTKCFTMRNILTSAMGFMLFFVIVGLYVFRSPDLFIRLGEQRSAQKLKTLQLKKDSLERLLDRAPDYIDSIKSLRGDLEETLRERDDARQQVREFEQEIKMLSRHLQTQGEELLGAKSELEEIQHAQLELKTLHAAAVERVRLGDSLAQQLSLQLADAQEKIANYPSLVAQLSKAERSATIRGYLLLMLLVVVVLLLTVQHWWDKQTFLLRQYTAKPKNARKGGRAPEAPRAGAAGQ